MRVLVRVQVLNYVVMIIINMIVATDCNLRLEPRSFGTCLDSGARGFDHDFSDPLCFGAQIHLPGS